MSMTRIWERLYLGSLQDAADLAAANPFGITAVLSLSALGKCHIGQAGSTTLASP